jgi:hypothetical protein
MDINVLKSLIANAQKYLPQDEFVTFRKQVNEIYLQSELNSLYAAMPLDTAPEPWRAERILKINQQLAAL